MLIATFALNCLADEVEEKAKSPHQPNRLQLPSERNTGGDYLKIVRLPRIAR